MLAKIGQTLRGIQGKNKNRDTHAIKSREAQKNNLLRWHTERKLILLQMDQISKTQRYDRLRAATTRQSFTEELP